jgi:hypothetical protein
VRETLATFSAWLELTPFSRVLQTVEWAVPAIQTVHILAIAAVMGSMLLFNLRLLGVRGADVPLARVRSRFLPVVWFSAPSPSLQPPTGPCAVARTRNGRGRGGFASAPLQFFPLDCGWPFSSPVGGLRMCAFIERRETRCCA